MSTAAQASCVDVAPTGGYCAVGFRDGSYRLFKTGDWTAAGWQSVNKSKKITKDLAWIEDIKFSPDSTKFAAACHDNQVHVIAVADLSHVATLPPRDSEAGGSFISHLDWSEDGCYIRTNDGNYALRYYDLQEGGKEVADGERKTGRQAHKLKAVKALRDKRWATQTCPVSWATQGIWTSGVQATDVNHCDRSSVSHPDGYPLLATAEDYG